ncbi:MAG: hypothetical protein OER56_01045 [Hyphomicrobiales bacterium]|nr:hypothetical protein [Hyphomicrobiales bacterium]
MVRPVTSSNIPHPATRPAASQPIQDVGKSSNSIGHQAKAAVALAAADGQELPKNAQGKFASALARGLDPATILILQDASAPVDDTVPVADDPVAGDPVADDPVVDEPIGDVLLDEPVADPVVDEPVVDTVADEPVGEVVLDDPVVDPVADEPVAEVVADEPVVEVVADEPVIELPEPDTTVLDPVLTDLLIDNEDPETT